MDDSRRIKKIIKRLIKKELKKIISKSSKVEYVEPKIELLNSGEVYHAGRHSKVRVLMVLDQFHLGGTETHSLTLTRELLKKGVHVVVAGKKGRMLQSFTALGCPVYDLNFYVENGDQRENVINQLQLIIKNENISLIHAHQVPSGRISAIAAKRMRIPFVFSLHGSYDELLDIPQYCSAIICVSPPMKALISHYDQNLPVSLIPNGIDTVEYNYSPYSKSKVCRELSIPEDYPIVMYAARLTWDKGVICEIVIKACKSLRETNIPNLQLLVVGDGNHTDEIKRLTQKVHSETNNPFIHFIGESFNINSYFSCCDCFIGTGRTALEAMACGSPVIAIGGSGYFGLVKPDNYEHAWNDWFGDHQSDKPWSESMLIDHIQEVIYAPEDEKLKWSYKNREFVKERFNIIEIAERVLTLYQDLLS